MPTDIKRMRFFDGLFLQEDEFNLEQNYHIRMRRLINRHLHGYGIAFGLEIEPGPGSREITIKNGLAFDKYFDSTNSEEIGREINVVQDQVLDLVTLHGEDASVYVYVSYNESQADVVPDRGGAEPIHWLEGANIGSGTALPDTDTHVILAKVNIVGGVITTSGILTEENGQSLRTYIITEPEPVTGGGTTIIQTGGTGKNYVVNSDAETNASAWNGASSGQFDVTTTNLASNVLSGTTSFLLVATGLVTAESDYVTVELNEIDQEDLNQNFAVEFSFKGLNGFTGDSLKVVIRDTTNNVDIIPGPNQVPVGQGKYRGVFGTTDSRTYELRLVCAQTGNDFDVVIDSVVVGPNNLTLGAAIGGWVDAGPIVFRGEVTDPQPGTTSINKMMYRRVGDTMEFAGFYHQTAAGVVGSGRYFVELPGGYHADFQYAHPDPNNGTGANTWGMCQTIDEGKSQLGVIEFADDRRFSFLTASAVHTEIFNSDRWNFADTEFYISFKGSVPIVEWQSDIVLAESRTEYVYNSDGGAGDNFDSFAAGEIGALVPSIPGGPAQYEFPNVIRKRIRLSRPFKHVALEFDTNGSGSWSTTSKYNRFFLYNANSDTLQLYGAVLEPVSGSDTQWDVVFSGNAHVNEVTRADRGWDAVATEDGTRWRVVASDNPFFVEAPPVATPGEVGPWTDAGPMTIIGTTTNPTFGNVIDNKISYRRVGDTMEFAGQFHQNSAGTNGTGEWHIELPAGLNAASVAYEATDQAADGSVNDLYTGATTWGTATVHQVNTKGASGSIQFVDSRRFTMSFTTVTPVGWVPFEHTNFSFANPDFMFSFHGSVPIAEWTNTDLVLRESLTEYVYNSNSDNADNSSALETGADGGRVPNIPYSVGSVFVRKRCRNSRPFKHRRLEFNVNGDTFWTEEKFKPQFYQDGSGLSYYGAYIEPISSLEFDVVFQAGGGTVAAADNGGTPWSILHGAGTTWRVVCSDNPLFVESGVGIQGNVIGPWTDAGPVVWRGSTGSHPLPGPTSQNNVSYRRVGDTMEIQGVYRQTSAGTQGAGTFLIEIPNGLSAAATGDLLDVPGLNTVGTATTNEVGLRSATGSLAVFNPRHLCLVLANNNGILDQFSTSQGWSFATSNTLDIVFHGFVPIAEWSQNDVVLQESRVEYVFNTSDQNTNDTTSFASGESGALVPPISAPGPVSVRVQFARAHKHVKLEIMPNGGGWVDIASTSYRQHYVPPANGGGGNQGMYLIPVAGSSTQWDVAFAEGGYHKPGVGYETWPQVRADNARWRVVGSDNPMFVEAARADYVSATSDQAVSTGSSIWPPMNGNSVILQPGDWQLNGSCWFSNTDAGIGYTFFNTIWTLANGTGTTTAPPSVNPILLAGFAFRDAVPSTSSGGVIPTTTILVRVTVPTEVFLCMAGNMNGNPAGSLLSCTIYAQRMA